MTRMILPLILAGLVLIPCWPLFFRRWKHGKVLWILSPLIVVALGAWSMAHFSLEKHYARLAEAEAVEATRAALAEGGDVSKLADSLERLGAEDAFKNGGVRARYRLWFDTVKGAAR